MQPPRISSTLLVLTVWIWGCQNNQDSELAKARAEAQAARAELARLQAAAPPKAPLQAKISGELFATTQGGDVKKGAGVKVYLIPLTAADRELVANAHGRFIALETAYEGFMQELKRKYPRRNEFSPNFVSSEKQEVKSQETAYNAEFNEYLKKHHIPRASEIDKGWAAILVHGQVATANSDGRFEFHVPAGEYLLLTEQKSFATEKLLWLNHVEVRSQDVSLSLDQKSAVFGHSMAALSTNLEAIDVQFRDIVSAAQSLIAAELSGLVKQAEQREAASLAQAIAANPVRDARPVQITAANPPEDPAPPEPSETVTEEEKRMQVIFRDWAKQRGDALKKASKMSKSAAESHMRRIDQGLVKSLTKKYQITHEELDRIEAYGAKKNWWERK